LIPKEIDMKHSMKLAALALAAAVSACAADGEEDQDVVVDFAAVVGASPFACGQTYTGLGTTGTAWQPKDFRLYVHDVKLVTEEGEKFPVTLANDGKWQLDGVGLLDFEDASGLCTGGTPEKNTRLVGKVAKGTYHRLELTVGVPFARNHLAVDAQPSPLNLTALYWAWTSGYKFIRLDGNTTGQPVGVNLHLGSTGCTPVDVADVSKGVTSCAAPNRPTWNLHWHGTETVTLDVAALFAGSDLDADGGVAPGCMSGGTDPECGPVFSRLGLPFGTTPAGVQAFASTE
jgi:uncharacterized repeat protein (TIGR04052 family)